MSKADFLTWDNDINLDELLGEYTDYHIEDSDSDFELEIKTKTADKKGQKDDAPKESVSNKAINSYTCPHCSKVLKTISGFRGHVTKQHGDSKSRASECRTSSTNSAAQLSSKQDSIVLNITLTDDVFEEAYVNCLKAIDSDPINQLLNPGILEASKLARGSNDIRSFFKNEFSDIFVSSDNFSLAIDREVMFNKLHNFRINKASQEQCVELFQIAGCNSLTSVTAFIQLFSIEIIGEIFKSQIKKQKSAYEQAPLSDNDQRIIYYICGYLPRALKKKYNKVKNIEKRELKIACVDRLVEPHNDTASKLSAKYSTWTKSVSRGGLTIPSEHCFLLVREMENIIRKTVDMENLHGRALLCDPLKEAIMESFMVKYYCDKLFSPATDKFLPVFEDIVHLFLTVRGHATTRLVRNKHARTTNSKSKSKSKSFRAQLKPI